MAEEKKQQEEKKPAPFIKKVKKVNAAGHHGGAWKIAYADFVTAMMAFFLLLWLLSTTPSKTLQGIADYFAPTVGLKDQMGIGFYGGKTPLDEGTNEDDQSSKPTIIYGSPNTGPKIKEPSTKKPQDEGDQQIEDQVFKEAKQEIMRSIQSQEQLRDMLKNLNMTNTQEGLRIDIFDIDKVSMFKVGSTELEPKAKELLKNISEVISKLPNNISIIGHTDSLPYSGGSDYGNWELSADRANASRRYLEEVGFAKERIAKVGGTADQEPLVPDNPKSPLNRRISITLLYKSVSHYDAKPTQIDFMHKPDMGGSSLIAPKINPGASNLNNSIDPILGGGVGAPLKNKD